MGILLTPPNCDPKYTYCIHIVVTLGAKSHFRNPKDHITITTFGLEKSKRYMGYRDFHMEYRRYSK